MVNSDSLFTDKNVCEINKSGVLTLAVQHISGHTVGFGWLDCYRSATSVMCHECRNPRNFIPEYVFLQASDLFFDDPYRSRGIILR